MDAVRINAAAALAAAATLAVAGVHIAPVDVRSGIAWYPAAAVDGYLPSGALAATDTTCARTRPKEGVR